MSEKVISVEEIEGLTVEITKPNPEEFITTEGGDYIYIPTAMKTNDTDLKLRVLNALVKERLKTKAELTDIIGFSVRRYLDLQMKYSSLSSESRDFRKRIDFLESCVSQLKKSRDSEEKGNTILGKKVRELQNKLALAEKDLEKKSIPWYKKIFK